MKLLKIYKTKREYKIIDGVNTRTKEFDEKSERQSQRQLTINK